MKVFLIDEDQITKLRAIEQRLHSGSDAMRDEGHKLWLVLKEVVMQETDEKEV